MPIRIKQRGRRKLVTLPDGETVAPKRPWDDAPTSIQMALARGHRWLAMLDKSARSGFGPRSGPRRGEPQGWGEQSGEAGSLREIADREGVDNSYVSRMINLTCLAPDIVAAILDDTLPDHVTLFDLAVDSPRLWEKQRKTVSL